MYIINPHFPQFQLGASRSVFVEPLFSPSILTNLLAMLNEPIKLDVDKSINKSFRMLNELINKANRLSVGFLDESLETLKIIENCITCKDNMGRKYHFNQLYESMNEIENLLTELEKGKEEIKRKLNIELS